jgi:uncharacterized membrane protein YvbJ
MVVCPKCGAKNEEDAKYCAQCGTDLKTGAYPSRRQRPRREEECFGIPKGGTFVGLAIGAIIIIWGFIMFLEQAKVISTSVEIWPIAAIIFGILILVGALYGLSRK